MKKPHNTSFIDDATLVNFIKQNTLNKGKGSTKKKNPSLC
jgi:hypothetical protein